LPVILSLPNLANIICDYLTEITHLTTPFLITNPHWYHYVILSIFVALAGDFAYYCYHYLAHRSSFFWEFHKVHHSADVLTPMTVYRSHPFDLLLSMIFATVMLGFTTGIWIYLFGNQVSLLSIYGINWEIFLFYLTGANLRHSHIWLNYPYKVSHVLMSPAQHHIHHSVEPKHYDKNFGYILSFWDWIFGTLYVPKGYEKLDFGLSDGESSLFNNPINLLVQPFKSIWQSYNQKISRE
jgi:sterol desaturase/sphingolipid hydroxylase (fatty acid hydroxylase superfamily)